MKFSLRSLFVLSTAVAVLAWIGVTFPFIALILLGVVYFLLVSFCFGVSIVFFWTLFTLVIMGIDACIRACRQTVWRLGQARHSRDDTA